MGAQIARTPHGLRQNFIAPGEREAAYSECVTATEGRDFSTVPPEMRTVSRLPEYFAQKKSQLEAQLAGPGVYPLDLGGCPALGGDERWAERDVEVEFRLDLLA